MAKINICFVQFKIYSFQHSFKKFGFESDPYDVPSTINHIVLDQSRTPNE
jgi:hypothetical protein